MLIIKVFDPILDLSGLLGESRLPPGADGERRPRGGHAGRSRLRGEGAVGVYGLLSYDVTRRTPEIGIRMAVGAQKGDVVRLVMREVALVCGVGIAVGSAAALMMARLVESLVFQTAGVAASSGRLSVPPWGKAARREGP